MKDQDLETININQGQIIYSKKEVKKGINKPYLTSILNKFYNNPMVAEELCTYIMENRETDVKESVRLKREKK
jgi:hypothetical protein